MDGKESRGSGRKQTVSGDVKALHTLNVYSSQYGMCLAQKFMEEKTNEIPAAQELLKMMDLKDSIVTADALNCQKETMEAITKSIGEYVLALKGNQGNFHKEAGDYFNDPEMTKEIRKTKGNYHKTVEKDHGGIATREYYIT